MTTRPSLAKTRNADVVEVTRREGQSNTQWLQAAIGDEDAGGSLLLIGGSGLTDFRLRVAQSQVRMDLLPSFWSHVAIIRSREANGSQNYKLYEVSLEPAHGFGVVPRNNAVQEGLSSYYDDVSRYPNIAWLRFPVSPAVLDTDTTLDPAKKKTAGKTRGAKRSSTGTLVEAIDRNVDQFRKRRSMLDIAGMVTEWLGFAWGAADKGNPITKNIGIPSAVFAESVFAMLGVELTPGLATQSSCPEAIWQSATWWHEFYESSASLTSAAPSGKYSVGQREAAAVG
jgi:hypothetical protein